MKLVAASDAPKRVRFSVYALWTVLLFALVVRFVFFDSESMSLSKLLWLSALGAAIHGYFIIGISKGRNSARWVYPVLLVFGALASPPTLSDPFDVLPLLVQVLALIVLFTGDANRWFRRAPVPA
jgi:hypothetical protein